MKRDYPHWHRFNVEERLVFSTRHWLIVTRPHQITLGSCSILLKRRAQAMSDLTGGEFADLRLVLQRYEGLLREAFQPTKFNYVVSGQKDPDIHFHAIPRYEPQAAREFADQLWVDAYWPFFPDFPRTLVPEDARTLEEVTKKLRSGVRRWLKR